MAHDSDTDDDPITLEGEVIAVTDKAFLLDTEDGEPVWIPRSLIEDGDDIEDGDSGEFLVPEWFARKEGLA